MPTPRRHTDSATLTARFAAVRDELGVREEFGEDVSALAALRAAGGPLEGTSAVRDDRRDLELISVDPPGATDIDQAFHLERNGAGFVFWYAIADLAAWIVAGDPIDMAARDRGVTIYSPDTRVPLHPTVLSEGAASLLPGAERAALLWRIDLDQSGAISSAIVKRALVVNRSALTYREVQDSLDSGATDERLRLLVEVGALRSEQERQRGGVSLDLPEQDVGRDSDGHFELTYDAPLPVEHDNAQLSLCCGIAAARLMIDAGTGVLRTLPPADEATFAELRRRSLALGVDWPVSMTYPQWTRTLDATVPAHAALMAAAATTFRGAGYLPFDGDLDDEHDHAAIASPYAHVTAPLRRLIDRFGNECVLAACEGRRPADWLLESLDTLPSTMGAATQRASTVDRRSVDLMEAAVLEHRVGERFGAVVTGRRRDGFEVQLADPAVIARVADDRIAVGQAVTVALDEVDPDAGRVEFSVVDTA